MALKEASEPISMINYLHLDADKVLSACGKYGKHQMFAYVVTTCAQTLFAINMMVMPFIIKPAFFTCEFDDPKDQNWIYQRIDDDQCHIIDGNNWTVNCNQIPGSKYIYNETKMASEFGLVCDKADSVDHASSIFLLGGLLVAPIITQLSDSFGRRNTFLWPLYASVIANFFCAISPTYNIFLFFRFIAGVATSSFSMVGYVLCVESVALEFRSLTPLLTTVTWVTGYMLAGVLHLFIPNWRWLYFAISLPGLLTIPYYWWTPESLHWMITSRKGKQVRKFVETCERVNKQKIDLSKCMSDDISGQEGDIKRRTALDIFLNPTLLFSLIVNAIILIAMNGTYWGLSLFSTELSSDNEMLGYFLSGAVEVPAGFLSVYLLLVLDRKTVSFISLFLTSVFMCCALFVPLPDNYSMIFPLLAKSVNSIVWSSQTLLYAESMPTSIRNVFCGIVTFLGEIGSVAAPYLKRLEAIDKNAPALCIAILSFLAAICVIVLPETKGKKLPGDIDDFDIGPLLRRFKKSPSASPSLQTEEVSVPLNDIEKAETNEEK
ncbi:unnamed protein product [Caenorhabditis angaria]|uniref:Major facilitator superfamily (MFS) profile domain-containing protein n=1 Tax=Caenorhabditis angaria TaxID=860376 RepID=A0A9P1IZZ6_9PELO|nr:unnamed protein product [Caenorhabditis angaria]